MTTNEQRREKLIEEAREFVNRGWFRVDYPSAASIITRLADALAVSEKGHTPNVRDPEKTHIPTGGVSLSAHTSTDDERARADAAEDGLFRVVQALGFDTDGAKTAGEFFGPMTYCTGEGQYTDPAGIAVGYVTDYRAEMEAEADKADETIAALRSSVEKGHTPNVRDPEKTHIPTGGVSLSAHTSTDDERADERQAQMIAFETAKLEARNSMRHDPHVWHEALEDALDKVLPAVWHAAAGFRRSEVPDVSVEPKHDESCTEWCNHCYTAKGKKA